MFIVSAVMSRSTTSGDQVVFCEELLSPLGCDPVVCDPECKRRHGFNAVGHCELFQGYYHCLCRYHCPPPPA
ncbi:hypothetical protein L6164_018461 [Bauhinia variegata]|uniref:Uncharacterized protein n=1 Tax=Bauhinia variegata TaxID=167791 RepID=A0ACB9NB91_BAUVA|nr:hypothetical protein L6164_018461 [Bauhinia variegata]